MAGFFSEGFFNGFGKEEGGESKPVENSQLYEVLNISKTATQADIKKQHKKLVRIHHPDRGGDVEKFKEI